jgi:16S rRNA (uracil1498-N3)-methyltransferase
MIRIFVPPASLVAGELAVRGDEHHYLGRVRRARVGDAIELVDGAGRRASAVIARIAEAETILRVDEPAAIPARGPHVRVAIPPIKGDRMDACIEKLVEVGADDIVVWPAARAVVRLAGDRLDARIAHYQAAAQSAARQCGRAAVPTVSYAADLAAIGGAGIVLDPACDEPLAAPAGDAVTLISGPEGGLAPDELEQLAAAGFSACSLGPRVLRAETAPVVAVALIRAYTRS